MLCFCLDGPDIECSDSLELLEGETLESHCPVTGKPFPFINWQYNGQTVDPAVPLTRENKGNYTVKAEGYSFASRTLQVAVLCECHIRSSQSVLHMSNKSKSILFLHLLSFM